MVCHGGLWPVGNPLSQLDCVLCLCTLSVCVESMSVWQNRRNLSCHNVGQAPEAPTCAVRAGLYGTVKGRCQPPCVWPSRCIQRTCRLCKRLCKSQRMSECFVSRPLLLYSVLAIHGSLTPTSKPRDSLGPSPFAVLYTWPSTI